MELSENQVDWIFQKACKFTQRWLLNIPKDDSDWEQVLSEARELLYSKARNNELMRSLLVQSINYIDGISQTREKPLDML